MTRVANRLEELARERNLSLQQLADALGWTKSKVHRLATGATALNLADMRHIGRRLNIKPSRLLCDEDMEYRSDGEDQVIHNILAGIAPAERPVFLSVCREINRLVGQMAARNTGVPLGGPVDQASELAALWAQLNDEGRRHVLGFLHTAARVPRAFADAAA